MNNRIWKIFFYLMLILTISACGTTPEPTLKPINDAPPPINTATPRPTNPPTPTRTLIPTYTCVPTITPSIIPIDVFNIGPFERVIELNPEIFGPKPWLDAVLWHDYETNITSIEGWNGIVRILPDITQTRVIGEDYQLVGYDDYGLAYIISKQDGMIHRIDPDYNSQILSEGWQTISFPQSLRGMGITTDFNGNVWLATHFDIRRFDGQKWTIWTRTDLGMASNDGGMISPLKTHGFDLLQGLWLTSCDDGGPGPNGGGGARWWDGTRWQGAGTPVDTGCVTSVFQDNNGIYWVGVEHELWQYNPISDSWQSHPYITAPEPYYRAYAHEIVVSPQGIPWISFNLCGGASCYDFQLAYYQNDTWQLVGEIAFMPHNILLSPGGEFWLLDPSGVYKLENDEMVLVSEIIPLAGVFDQRERLWLVGMDSEYIPAFWLEVVK